MCENARAGGFRGPICKEKSIFLEEVAMKPFIFGLAAALAVLGSASVASADCLDNAKQAIEAKGITDWNRDKEPPVLEKVYMVQDIQTGYRAWFHVARCDRGGGQVVVNMQTGCQVTDIWTKGDCDPAVEQALSH
jgi:hypothetical protein